MSEEVKIALVGIGGYGKMYADALFASAEQHGAKLVAGVDPAPERSAAFLEFQRRKIPTFPDLDQFYEGGCADLVINSTPIHLHASITRKALEHGSNVLCEKPVSGTIQEGLRMLEAEKATGRFVAIGYQWSFSAAILSLKEDIRSGLFGGVRFLKIKVFWPRSDRYYNRNLWAGCQKLGESWVLDSPVNNATAHYLNNAFFVLGSEVGSSAKPSSVQAELYRAREIENYDTAALRCMTDEGVEILFYSTHATQEFIGPVFEYNFDEAVVKFPSGPDEGIGAYFKNGDVKRYGNPDRDGDYWQKIWGCVEAVRRGSMISGSLQSSLAQTICMNGAQESAAEISSFPEGLIRDFSQDGEYYRSVDGLQVAFEQCFDLGALPAELETFPWAYAGEIMDLNSYDYFPSWENVQK